MNLWLDMNKFDLVDFVQFQFKANERNRIWRPVKIYSWARPMDRSVGCVIFSPFDNKTDSVRIYSSDVGSPLPSLLRIFHIFVEYFSERSRWEEFVFLARAFISCASTQLISFELLMLLVLWLRKVQRLLECRSSILQFLRTVCLLKR